MSVLTISGFPGRYVQGPGAMDQLEAEVARLGNRALCLCDAFVLDNAVNHLVDSLDSDRFIWEHFSGECSDEAIERASNRVRSEGCQVLVGMGGGKTIDTAKAAAEAAGVPVVIVPTAASSDAPCSAVAVVYEEDGTFKRVLKLKSNPAAVLVDTTVISQAPVRLLIAGLGDALATWFEARSVYLTGAPNVLGGRPSLTAYYLSRLCYDIVNDWGDLAIQACRAEVVTPALEKVVEASILLSGIGFESGGLATAHALHNALTVLPETHGYLHGEKVAFGVLTSLFLTGSPPEEIERVFGLADRIGLPITLQGIGLDEASYEDLLKVGEACCAQGTNIHHEAFDPVPNHIADAMLAADFYGTQMHLKGQKRPR